MDHIISQMNKVLEGKTLEKQRETIGLILYFLMLPKEGQKAILDRATYLREQKETTQEAALIPEKDYNDHPLYKAIRNVDCGRFGWSLNDLFVIREKMKMPFMTVWMMLLCTVS